MRTIALQCNHCGAPLQVSESARFVTCTHCGTQLTIRQQACLKLASQVQLAVRQQLLLLRLESSTFRRIGILEG